MTTHIVIFDAPDVRRQSAPGIAARVKPTRRRLNIMSMLATGWLPWGVKWSAPGEIPSLPLSGTKYIMCCGHVLRRKEAQEFVTAGLLTAVNRNDSRPALGLTAAGLIWLQGNWR